MVVSIKGPHASLKEGAQSHQSTSHFTPDISCPFVFLSAITVWEFVAQNKVFLPVYPIFPGTAGPVTCDSERGH